jgi:hypothetical protein
MVDGGGKGLSEGRRTASPSIRAYSRPESFPQGYLAPEDGSPYGGLSAQACSANLRGQSCTVVVTAKAEVSPRTLRYHTEVSQRCDARRNNDDHRRNSEH